MRCRPYHNPHATHRIFERGMARCAVGCHLFLFPSPCAYNGLLSSSFKMVRNVFLRVMRRTGRLTGMVWLCAGIVSLLMMLCVLWCTRVGPPPRFREGCFFTTTIHYSTYFRFIPPDVVRTWKAREYLVVMGIPSIDIDARRRLRALQRETWWKYDEVARQRNNFTGEFLPLYLLAPHQDNGYEISESLWKEAAKSHDVIVLPTCDVRPTTRKRWVRVVVGALNRSSP
ncbi:unnamed protein product [Trypanosoma congolense IL3000]|uniref:WGS project CAEQ00000000 data, annotated contig 2097 n=1 Tax=Trypanosoma congolense (strain IL3000) TaxID=1068625 RepID=F9WBE8_TRYCI|nr:unnamed protein product [Trypanosoma congolense IL3000]